MLINNAGRTQRCFCIQTALEVDKDIYATNVVGALSLTKLVLPHMVARKSGHIIVVTSIAGRTGLFDNHVNYVFLVVNQYIIYIYM